MSDQNTSDEIDLIELLEILWAGKWFIAIVTSLAAVTSFMVLSSMQTKYEMTLSIRPLSAQQMSAYAPLNNVPGISPPIYAGEILIGQTGVILADDLRDQFLGVFRASKALQAAIYEHDLQLKNFEGTEQEKSDALIRAAAAFKLKFDATDNVIQITTVTTKPDITRSILLSLIEKSSDIIRRDNLTGIANLSQSIETALNHEIAKLKQAIENDRRLYLDNINMRIAILGEQAKIARALGIEMPVNETNITTSITMANPDDSSNGTFDRNTRLFMRGYKALETEAKILKSRNEAASNLFSRNYAENASQLRKLQNDRRLERIETGVALTPLSDADNFIPVNFDAENILTTPASNKLLVLILVTLISGLISSAFILIRTFVSNRKLTA